MKFKIAEKFVSINGEGTRAGELAIFIRFAGCNLSCCYCDTAWANQKAVPLEYMTEDEIFYYIKKSQVKNVTLTGGEPLIQEGIFDLIQCLSAEPSLRIEIETNGSIDILPFCLAEPNRPVFTMDYKLGSSDMEGKMLEQNFIQLNQNDTVKFVVGNFNELQKSTQIIDRHNLINRCNVHLSPVYEKFSMEQIVIFMKDYKLNGVRLQPQLHKIVWHPSKRGV